MHTRAHRRICGECEILLLYLIAAVCDLALDILN